MKQNSSIFERLVLHVLLTFVLLTAGEGVVHAENKTTLYFFWGNGCPHCEREKVFLGELE